MRSLVLAPERARDRYLPRRVEHCNAHRQLIGQGAHLKIAKTTVSARISPVAGMDVLSRDEVSRLRDASRGGLHALLRRCALAVLTSGTMSDDPRNMLERFPDFDIQVLQQDRGVKLELMHAPATAFV